MFVWLATSEMNGRRIIERTFLHFPGIGPARERSLWAHGIRSWEAFGQAIQAGTAPGDLFRHPQAVQYELFPGLAPPLLDPTAREWLHVLGESQAALREGSLAFFLSRLPPAEHWRVLASALDDALYLDIETTGLSRIYSQITVIGALQRNRFHQWVWPQRLDGLAELLEAAPIVVTFNGVRFDLPFLQAHLPMLPQPRAHIDLMPIAGACDATGGQKLIERHFDLTRDEGIREMDGLEAVLLWSRAVYGDAEGYERLLYYNRTDVEMLPRLAARLCEVRSTEAGEPITARSADAPPSEIGHAPLEFADLRCAWKARQVGLPSLVANLHRKLGRDPVVVGVDLRGNPKNPTGWARCEGGRAECRIVHSDDEILKLTRAAKPDLVSIDAPLCLPRGRVSVSDDSPCRAVGGIVREAERILWARGIRVYPALIRHMQGLTQRGIDLTVRLHSDGLNVIESYPGAAQDILGIPRKGADLELLRQGLTEFGFEIAGAPSHDELDAVTSALVGYFYMAGECEGVGAEDEGFLIVPRWNATKGWGTEGEAA
jgi:uncharacterized protein YprB with RNaseH-like and TPR domain/predicted nuclease with RNAse H fold